MTIEARTLQSSFLGVDTLRHIFAATRPHEWVKNTFVVAPLVFSQNAFNVQLALKSWLAFCIFCCAAGGVYLINDICDRTQDREHPEKRHRPIAAGVLSVNCAAWAAALLLAIAIAGAFVLGIEFGVVTVTYVVLVVSYSNWLKHIVIVDVFAIAAGFVLRVTAGAVVVDVVMSHWLIICTMLLALFLGLSKRRYEIVTSGGNGRNQRKVLAEYDPLFLDMMIGIVTSATVVSYALYTVSHETIQRFQTDRLILTLPFVLYGIFRYLYLVYHKNHGGNPSQHLMSDVPLLIDIIMWVLICGLIIYIAHL